MDSHKVRTGYLEPRDWTRLTHAAGRLAEAPIYIDDSPALSVLEARAKARRLKAEHGLDLVVIDYLQLMRGRNPENRQQEISEISRSLKALATCGEMIEYRFGPQQMRLASGTKEEMEQVLGELMTAWWSDIEIGFYEDRGPTYVITFKINNK